MKAPQLQKQIVKFRFWHIVICSLLLCFNFITLQFTLAQNLSSSSRVGSLSEKNGNEYPATTSSCCGASHAHGQSWIEPGIVIKADLLCIHGLGLCSKGYESFGKYMSKLGIATYAIDVHGFGPRSEGEGKTRLNLDKTVSDIKIVLESLHQKNPERPIFLLGESMGGSIALRVASLYPETISGLICSAPAWKLYKEKQTALKGLLGLLIHTDSRVRLAAMGVMEQATSKIQLRQHWLLDDDHRLELSPSEALSFIRFIHKTPRSVKHIETLPVLVVQGLHDRLVKPKGAARLFKRLPAKDKLFVLDGEAEHLIFEEGQFCNDAAITVKEWMLNHCRKTAVEQTAKYNGILLEKTKLTRHDKEAAQALFKEAGTQFDEQENLPLEIINPIIDILPPIQKLQDRNTLLDESDTGSTVSKVEKRSKSIDCFLGSLYSDVMIQY